MKEKEHIDILKVSEKLENTRKKALRTYRQRRKNEAVRESLTALKEAAQGDENLMPHIVRAVESQATLGEISDTLRGVFGTYDT